MIEFGVLCAAWLAFLVFASRKGTAHLLRPHVSVTLPVAFGLAAALLEALPTMAVSPGFTLRTVIAIFAGVFAGRLFGRIVQLWARGHERRGTMAKARFIHPLIAAGMFVAGVPVLWHVLTSNCAFIEEALTPRDEKTGIAHGCEEIRVERGGDAAVLLLHGLYGSPAEFGELPARLSASGLDVFAPLLPGHGLTPDSLDAVWSKAYEKSVGAAFDGLAAKHKHVAVVGAGMGGTLALLVASERKPSALVLANPYLGHFATPTWSPVSFDSLVGPLSRVARRVFVNEDRRGRGYSTLSLHAARQCSDLAKLIESEAKTVACPTLVIATADDRVLPPQFAVEWTTAHLPAAKTSRLPAGGHDLYFGADAAQAIDETAAFLVENAKR